MKKTLVTLLALVFVLGIAGTALAAPANPFVDVPAKHWAYDAVSKLVKAGIVDGYGDGTFRGDKSMTRYEMAQVVAKAMAKSDKADAENKALIDKLAVEFAAELNNLGVRVAKLESKTNHSIMSETLFGWATDSPPAGVQKVSGADAFGIRERLYFHADVNDATAFDARLQMAGWRSFGTSDLASGASVGFDRIYFTTKSFLGLDKVVWGRQPLLWGQGGLSFKTGGNDGVTAYKKLGDNTDFSFGGVVVNPVAYAAGVQDRGNANSVYYANLGFKIDSNFKLNLGYFKNDQAVAGQYAASKGYDLGLQTKLGDWTLIGEYAKVTLDTPGANVNDGPKFVAFQITNGTNLPQYFYPIQRFLVDYNKPGTDAWALSYRKVDANAIPTGLGFMSGKQVTDSTNPISNSDTKGYFLTYQNVIAKSIVFSLEYQDLKNTTTGADKDKLFQAHFQLVF